MEAIRIRIMWEGSERVLMNLWQELINLGHQRFRIKETNHKKLFWIELFLPELLKYGIPKDSGIDLNKAFLWPFQSSLRPVFRGDKPVMFLNINYYGIYYDDNKSVFRACTAPGGGSFTEYSEKLRHAHILRRLGIPFDVFRDYQKIWPILDYIEPDKIYEYYYFQKTSEI